MEQLLRLLCTPSNAALGQVVGTHLYGNLIAGQDADVVHTQLAGNMGQNLVAIGQYLKKIKRTPGNSQQLNITLFNARGF